MALIHLCNWVFGSFWPIWSAGGFDANTKVLDADDADDVDGNGRWGFQVSSNQFAGNHQTDFRVAYCDGDTSEGEKVRIGMSFKFHSVGDDESAPGIGKYVFIQELPGANVVASADHWAWGVEVVGVGNYAWALYYWDNSAVGWVHVGSAGSLSADTWYYVTLELDGFAGTAALYTLISDDTETNVIAAQSEPGGWDGDGYYEGGWGWLNEQESGKGTHNTLYSICNVQVSDSTGSAFTGRVDDWDDRHVIEAHPEADHPDEDDWTGTDNTRKWLNVCDYNREGGCGAAGDDIKSSTDGHEQLFEIVDVANVRGLMLWVYGSAGWGHLGHHDFLAEVTEGAEAKTGDLEAELSGAVNSTPTIDALVCHRLQQTPESNAWTDARVNSLRAGVEKDGTTESVIEEFAVVVAGDTGAAIARPAAAECPAEEAHIRQGVALGSANPMMLGCAPTVERRSCY